MMQNDSAILSHFVEEWSKVIPGWVDKNKDNLTARNILNQRPIGEDVLIDVMQKYDRTGPGAQIISKGAVPESMGIKTTDTPFSVYQIATGFWVNAKDLKVDPKTKNRLIEISLADIHRKEDDFVLNGSTKHNVNGIVAAAQANPNGKIVASGASGNDINNKGKWAGETGTDIYDDVNSAIGLLGSNFKPTFLVGHSKDLRYLYRMDSERQQYYKTMSILFNRKDPDDVSWIWPTDVLSRGKVYIVPVDTLAADFVISENPNIIPYPMSPGQNYWIELASWSVPEIYDNEAFVEIAIT
jgi:hypothetical protein